MNDILKALAPTLASAVLGPLGGVAVSAIGKVLGIDNATTESVSKAFQDGKLTSDQLAKLQELELQYQNEEKERGFKYSDLEFRDRDSARKANVEGGTQKYLFWLSMLLLAVSLGSEVWVLFNGYPDAIPEIVVGRILGLLDSVTLMVLTYWYGTTNSSAQKNTLLANSMPVK